MKFARIVPILLSGVVLGVAAYTTPSAPRYDATSDTATIDTTAGSSPISVTALAPGDELRISYESHGCFHAFRYSLTIRRDRTGPEVQMDSAEAILVPGRRLALTQSHLDRTDLVRLDKLLMFYRSNTNKGCTTVDTIEVTSVEGGVMRQESYVDGSCATFEDKTVLPIWQLVRIAYDPTAPD